MKSSKIKTIVGRILFFLTVCFVFIMPILSLLRMSLTTDGGFGLQNYMDMLHEDRTSKAIRNTLIISIASTVIAVAAGSFFAFLNAYTNIKRKKMLELLVLAPYIIPSYIITLSWSSLLLKRGLVNTFLKNIGLPVIDIYTLPGIILVMGICNIPVVYLLVVGMLRKIPRDMEWAGRTSGYTPLQTIRKITMVQAMPAIASGGMLAFLASIDNFSIPAFLGISSGIPVLSTYIYEKAISFGALPWPEGTASRAASSVFPPGSRSAEESGIWRLKMLWSGSRPSFRSMARLVFVSSMPAAKWGMRLPIRLDMPGKRIMGNAFSS